jgi:hypothetical protein
MSWNTILWIAAALGVAYVALIVARAVQMHFQLKRQLEAQGVELAKKRPKDAQRP